MTTPMRTADHWKSRMNTYWREAMSGPGMLDYARFISDIQADARRAAIEECIARCEQVAAEYEDVDGANECAYVLSEKLGGGDVAS